MNTACAGSLAPCPRHSRRHSRFNVQSQILSTLAADESSPTTCCSGWLNGYSVDMGLKIRPMRCSGRLCAASAAGGQSFRVVPSLPVQPATACCIDMPQTPFGRRNIAHGLSAMATVSTLSALSTCLPSAPITMLSAMTPPMVKAAISTVPIKLTALAIGLYLHWRACQTP